MKQKGFTLIELIVVIVILGVLSAVALPRFIDLTDDANQAVMESMKGALDSADQLVSLKIRLNPESLNGNQNRFTLDSGQNIRVRGGFADGRWNNTFIFLVDFDGTEQVNGNNCDDDDITWCVRQRNANWFLNRGYTTLGSGRGFVIFPNGNNVNQDRCYVYLINQNDSAAPATVQPTIIGTDFSEC